MSGRGGPGCEHSRESSRRLCEFARELLRPGRLPSSPGLLEDMLRSGVELLASRAPGLGLALWRRSGRKPPELLCLSEPRPPDPPEPLWRRAFPDGAESASGPLLFSAAGAAAFAWGGPGEGGLLVAADGAEPWTPELDLLCVHFTAATEAAAGLRELYAQRQRLEGGLSALRLVASTIGAHPQQAGSGLGAVASIVARAMEADLCAFLLYDEASGELVTQEGGYGLADAPEALYRVPVTDKGSSSARVFLSGEPFLSDDAQNDPQVSAPRARLWNCRSLMVAPLAAEGRRAGVIRVGSFRPGAFTRDQLRLLELIAQEAAVLVEGALLTRRVSEANRRLSEISRLKDEFVSTVSHEFKTPLTSIKGFLSVLLSGETGPLTLDQRRFLAIAEGAADRLVELVSDLLDLSRLEGGVPMESGPVSLAVLAEACVRDHLPSARQRGIELRLDLPARIPELRGDPKWLRQLLDNLVSNAIKFTDSGGRVGVSAAYQGEMVRVTVQDTGIGIPPEDREKIFEKFYRAKNRPSVNAPGTGLGLAIAKFVVDRHEGKIWADSELGRGSSFHCVLPVSGSRAPRPGGRSPQTTEEAP